VKIISWEDISIVKSQITGPVAISIGVFDGLHIGHQKLIEEVVRNPEKALPLIFTFTNNPAQVLKHREIEGKILSLNQKIDKLKNMGIAWTVLIDFSFEFSKLAGRDFINTLQSLFDISRIVVGYNFAIGYRKDTQIDELREAFRGSSTHVHVIGPTSYRGRIVSSSRIRKEIKRARFFEIRQMLGQDYFLDLSSFESFQEDEGWISLRRENLAQMIPDEGLFRVFFDTDKGKTEGEVVIDREAIKWKLSSAAEVNKIYFV
jgi:riboflavin kinase/FMN adenylyltransferase